MLISHEEAERKLNHPNNLKNLGTAPSSDSPAEPSSDLAAPEQAPGPIIPEIVSPADSIPTEPDAGAQDNPESSLEIRTAGRQIGDRNIPQPIRELIATAAQFDGVSEVAKAFGVSRNQVDNLKNLRTDRKSKRSKELEQAVNNNLDVTGIKELAMKKTLMALGTITEEDLKGAKIKDRAAVARDMASVAEKFTEQKKGRNAVRFVVHRPKTKVESEYEQIEVQAEMESS